MSNDMSTIMGESIMLAITAEKMSKHLFPQAEYTLHLSSKSRLEGLGVQMSALPTSECCMTPYNLLRSWMRGGPHHTAIK
jgi:hypothetical protein